jgi:CRISPR-associated protein (TIGR03986 family)
LRITELRCPQAEDAVEQIAELTLEPLSSPKPSQARFYLGAKDRNGAPLGADVRRSGFFDAETQSLRGRKFYPHHRELEGLTTEEFRQARRYDPPVDENGRVRPERDTQNVTIHEWVRPGTEFRFTVRVQNLHPLELGALLWLLDPQRCGNRQPARHRLGMGRPLGFGAVELTATRVEVQDGAGMRRFLDTLGAAPMSAEDPPDFAATFAESMTGEFAGALATLRLVLSGFPPRVDREPAPVRYPRNGRGPIYQWFVKNEEDAAAGAAQVLRRRGDRDHLDRNDERRP